MGIVDDTENINVQCRAACKQLLDLLAHLTEGANALTQIDHCVDECVTSAILYKKIIDCVSPFHTFLVRHTVIAGMSDRTHHCHRGMRRTIC